MKINGEHTKITEWIQGDNFVVRVEVDAIIPAAAPWEPCLEPATVRFLDDLQEKANRGLISELAKVGEVYVRQTA